MPRLADSGRGSRPLIFIRVSHRLGAVVGTDT
jgi:hypothetical protein